MATLSSVWSEILKLLDDGISVIPIRDKDEEYKGKIYTKKSSYGRWEKYQKISATKEELWFLLEKYNTTAIATICGKVSGNMEAIDVDVKWFPGIEKPLFKALKETFPILFPKLKIVKTPSGGYHIIYRVADGIIPPSKKIAGRPSSPEELTREKAKAKWFIETRGEDGYVAACPTEGYVIVQDVPVSAITWQEREDIIAICASFNKYVKEDTYKPTKQENIYYSQNPFEHFNGSDEAEKVLMNNGWKFHSKNSEALYFTRPGSKSGGIHATFLLRGKFYMFFTTNSDFETERCYNASSVKATLEFGGDKKKMFPELVKMGFGKINAAKENILVKKAAINNQELPANVSEQAKESLVKLTESLKKVNPYGIFWEYNEKGDFVINRERLYEVAKGLGFRYYEKELVKINGRFVENPDDREFFDAIKSYIFEEDGDELIKIYNSYEAFIEKHGDFSIERLCLLDETLLISDNESQCYKFFKNGYLLIDKNSIEFNDYESLKGLVLCSKIQQRDFIQTEPYGKYIEFIKLACNYEIHPEYLEKIIGYLSHEYKDTTTGYIIVLVEECPDPKQGGGSGKNIFSELLKYTTTISSKAGSQVKFDERFLQSWNQERVFAVHDVPKKFDFIFLKELSTGSGILKKLYKDEKEIPSEDMPKFVISTNYSYETTDGGLARRIIPLEFTDFFTKQGGVDTHFKCHFPRGWENCDWNGYDNFIAKSIQTWLRGERKIMALKLSGGGFEKQFDQSFPNIREFIEKNWSVWSEMYYVTLEEFKTLWDDYCTELGIKETYRPSNVKINDALKSWCKEKNYEFNANKLKRIVGTLNGPTRIKEFMPINAPF